MAPPQTAARNPAPKQSSVEKAKTRRTPRKRAISEVDEEVSVSVDDSERYDEDIDSADGELEESQESSQGGSGGRLEVLMETMVEDRRKRSKIRKAAIQSSYTQSVTNVQSSIDNLFTEHESQASQAQDSQRARLHKLLRKKADLEAAMQEKVITMRKAFAAHAEDLRIVLEKRVQQLA